MKRLLFAAMGAVPLVSACVPTAPPTLPAPVIATFSAARTSGSSPVTTALTWSISDPGSNALTCSLDLDDDGVYDKSISDCTSDSLRTATFSAVGVNAVGLRVSNGSSSSTATTTVTVDPPDPDTFDITLRLDPSIAATPASLVEAAANKWESIVKTGLPSEAISLPAGYSWPSVPAVDTTVDDLFIDVTVEPIDGPGGTVALGGGLGARVDGTTTYGAIAIDTEDLANLLLYPVWFTDTVEHEMGPVLGNSLAWSPLIDNSDPSDVRFTGQAAVGIFQELGGTGTIPLAGSGHWSEAVFGTELMTPSSSVGEDAELSAMTVASLADMNYGVDLAGADAYSIPAAAPLAAAPATESR